MTEKMFDCKNSTTRLAETDSKIDMVVENFKLKTNIEYDETKKRW